MRVPWQQYSVNFLTMSSSPPSFDSSVFPGMLGWVSGVINISETNQQFSAQGNRQLGRTRANSLGFALPFKDTPPRLHKNQRAHP